MGNIVFDFEEAILAQQQLQDIHREMEQLLNKKMECMLDEIGYAWRNQEGRLFLSKLQALREKMKNTSMQLQKAEDFVKEAIQTAIHTEEQAKEITETRK